MFRLPLICLSLVRNALVLILAAAISFPAQAAKTILILGDSLSAGYGIRQEAAWPSLLAQRLTEKKSDYSVVNASISGDTTSGGLTRLPTALIKHKPSIVIIALGSNDGLRGLPLRTVHENLTAMLDTATKAKARTVLVGQRLPPNYGAYADQFHALFGDVARTRKTVYVDYLLDGIATRPEFFQNDQLHPTAAAQAHILDNLWRSLEPLLK